MDPHHREYLAAAMATREMYGTPRQPQTHAVGDYIWVRQPGTENFPIRATVIEVLDDTTYHVAAHVPGQGRQHYAITPDDVLPF